MSSSGADLLQPGSLKVSWQAARKLPQGLESHVRAAPERACSTQPPCASSGCLSACWSCLAGCASLPAAESHKFETRTQLSVPSGGFSEELYVYWSCLAGCASLSVAAL